MLRDVEPFDDRDLTATRFREPSRSRSDRRGGSGGHHRTDVVVLEDPRLSVHCEQVGGIEASGSFASATLPPHALFDTAGLSLPPLWSVDGQPEESTIAGNGNGAFYLVPGGAFRRWHRRGRNGPAGCRSARLLGSWAQKVDQVAMAMALAAERDRAERTEADGTSPPTAPAGPRSSAPSRRHPLPW